MDKVLARIREPSTHAALAGIIAALIPLLPLQYQLVASGLAGAFGLGGVVMKERA